MRSLFLLIAVCLLAGAVVAYDGDLGNPGAPESYVPDVVLGGDRYAVLIDPNAPGVCDLGFRPESVSIYFQAGEGEAGTAGVVAALYEAVWMENEQRYVPGDLMCSTPDPGWVMVVDIPGEYPMRIPGQIGTPGDFQGCQCFDRAEPWFAVFHVGNLDAGIALDLGAAGAPTAGAYFQSRDGGAWSDLVTDQGWTSGLAMWTSVNCCSDPVANRARTWGSVKGLFR